MTCIIISPLIFWLYKKKYVHLISAFKSSTFVKSFENHSSFFFSCCEEDCVGLTPVKELLALTTNTLSVDCTIRNADTYFAESHFKQWKYKYRTGINGFFMFGQKISTWFRWNRNIYNFNHSQSGITLTFKLYYVLTPVGFHDAIPKWKSNICQAEAAAACWSGCQVH